MLKRFVSDILLLFSIIVMPWWLTVLFVIVLLFYFESFYEAIIAGFLIDFTYSIPTELLFGFRFIFTALFVILFLLSGPLKRRLRYYSR